MKVFIAFCLVASTFAYPQYVRYDPYPDQTQPPCSTCRANQQILRQSGSPAFQPGQPIIRYDRSVETAPVLVDSAESAPILVRESGPTLNPRDIFEEQTVPVLVKSDVSDIENLTPVLVDPPAEELIQETTGPVAERVVLLREESLKRDSRSPDDSSVPLLSMESFDDSLLPVLSDFSSPDFSRHARSVETTRAARSAMPEVIPILTNLPTQSINNEMIESILRSARSLSTESTVAAAEQPSAVTTKEVTEAPQSFGMYYVRVKSYNYLDDELPAAVKDSTTTKPCTKEQEQLQKEYFEQQDKEFFDFMQQLLVQQFTSLLEQQLVQQQDQLKKFLSKQLEDELKTQGVTTSAPVTPVNLADKVPESSASVEKIEVTVVEPATIPAKGKDLEAPSTEKAL